MTRRDQTGPGGPQTFNYTYDESGNTKTRPGQNLTWDAEGHLATVTTSGGQQTSYLYDAAGNRLVTKEPGVKTVYLPGMELRTVGTVTTATRFYSFGGKTVAVRTSSGVTFQAADHHGTNSLSINAVSGVVQYRRSTPYGGPRGTAPSSWPDRHGFVGGTEDTSGLTHLGAREYDPAIGCFISADPIMDLSDPQQWSAYGYSNNSPVTSSDPTGLLKDDAGGGGASSTNRGACPDLNNPAGTGKPGSSICGGLACDLTQKFPLPKPVKPPTLAQCSAMVGSVWSSPAACTSAWDNWQSTGDANRALAKHCDSLGQYDVHGDCPYNEDYGTGNRVKRDCYGGTCQNLPSIPGLPKGDRVPDPSTQRGEVGPICRWGSHSASRS